MITVEFLPAQYHPCVQNWIQTGSSYPRFRIFAIQSSDSPEAINEKLAGNNFNSNNYRLLYHNLSSAIEGEIYFAPGLHSRFLMNILTDYPANIHKIITGEKQHADTYLVNQ